MTETASRLKRQYPRISMPKGIFVAWHGGRLMSSVLQSPG